MRDLLHDSTMSWGRTARFTQEHSESSQHFTFRGKYRRGPAGLQPVPQGQITVFSPQRISGDVGDDDLLSEEGGPSARSRPRADGSAVKGTGVAGRKAGSRAVPKPVAIRIQQKNRTQRNAGNL